jgi:hypothetical protein
MKRKACLVLGAALLLLHLAVPAAAVSFSGKISTAQSSGKGIRFYVQAKGLSLFATGDMQALLLEAFFHKTTVDVAYTITPCTGGIHGTCGTVTFVSVDATNIP